MNSNEQPNYYPQKLKYSDFNVHTINPNLEFKEYVNEEVKSKLTAVQKPK